VKKYKTQHTDRGFVVCDAV